MLMIENRYFNDAHQRDCARVVAALHSQDFQTRASLAAALEMTSTAISRIIADLVARNIISEKTGDKKNGRGRPATQIALNPLCAGATILSISSLQLTGVLIDFKGNILSRETRYIGPETGASAMQQAMCYIVRALTAACPPSMIHVGTSVAVTGITDIRNRTWILTSRWPAIRDFDIGEALRQVTPTVYLFRQLDVELNARFAELGSDAPESAGVLHWGWGIGLAYRTKADTTSFQDGPFGEIGHWRFNILEDRPCGCGNYGCLETAVSLGALLPVIRTIYPDIAEDEETSAGQIARLDLADIPEIRMAVGLMARTLGNVCRILFPKKVFITGPFIANNGVFDLLQSSFRAEGLVGSLTLPTLVPDRSSIEYVLKGAAQPLFETAVDRLLELKYAP
ncbi:ROK family transcriptional regulator [Brucella sp. BE17]|uniref:ROK family transcriptional regulator n=1 Tax=Brucella sp. BE17 TaxID=3142977 RepID=UPI0031BAD6CB